MDVLGWLRNLGLEHYEAIFRDNDIDADMIFMSMVLHHFDDREQAVRECRRVLR